LRKVKLRPNGILLDEKSTWKSIIWLFRFFLKMIWKLLKTTTWKKEIKRTPFFLSRNKLCRNWKSKSWFIFIFLMRRLKIKCQHAKVTIIRVIYLHYANGVIYYMEMQSPYIMPLRILNRFSPFTNQVLIMKSFSIPVLIHLFVTIVILSMISSK